MGRCVFFRARSQKINFAVIDSHPIRSNALWQFTGQSQPTPAIVHLRHTEENKEAASRCLSYNIRKIISEIIKTQTGNTSSKSRLNYIICHLCPRCWDIGASNCTSVDSFALLKSTLRRGWTFLQGRVERPILYGHVVRDRAWKPIGSTRTGPGDDRAKGRPGWIQSDMKKQTNSSKKKLSSPKAKKLQRLYGNTNKYFLPSEKKIPVSSTCSCILEELLILVLKWSHTAALCWRDNKLVVFLFAGGGKCLFHHFFHRAQGCFLLRGAAGTHPATQEASSTTPPSPSSPPPFSLRLLLILAHGGNY